MAEKRKEEEKKDIKSDKLKALDLALSQIEKQFGKGSIMRLGQETRVDVAVIPTGALTLDLALGVGGVPRGRVIEIFGPKSSGKTTLTLSIISEAQRLGGVAAFVDAEHALDPTYAKKLGVNLDELLISQPDTGEQRRLKARWGTPTWGCRHGLCPRHCVNLQPPSASPRPA